MSRRAEQIASTLRRAVQQVLTEGLNDPRLQAMITITDAHVDDSLSEAVMSVSVIPEAKQDLVIHGLKAAAGRIRRTAADEIDLKRAPRLIFRLDTSLKKQAAVFGALAEVAREREEQEKPKQQDESTGASPERTEEPKGNQQP